MMAKRKRHSTLVEFSLSSHKIHPSSHRDFTSKSIDLNKVYGKLGLLNKQLKYVSQSKILNYLKRFDSVSFNSRAGLDFYS